MAETAVLLGAFETRSSTYRLGLVKEPGRPVLLRIGVRKRTGWDLVADVHDLGMAEKQLRMASRGQVGLADLTRRSSRE